MAGLVVPAAPLLPLLLARQNSAVPGAPEEMPLLELPALSQAVAAAAQELGQPLVLELPDNFVFGESHE